MDTPPGPVKKQNLKSRPISLGFFLKFFVTIGVEGVKRQTDRAWLRREWTPRVVSAHQVNFHRRCPWRVSRMEDNSIMRAIETTLDARQNENRNTLINVWIIFRLMNLKAAQRISFCSR